MNTDFLLIFFPWFIMNIYYYDPKLKIYMNRSKQE